MNTNEANFAAIICLVITHKAKIHKDITSQNDKEQLLRTEFWYFTSKT